jgi:capsular polysaccharide biosynthesis protein
MAVGLVIGVLLIGLGEYRDSSFHREEDVERLLSLHVLAVVPLMVTDGERLARRRRTVLLAVVSAVVVVGSAAVLMLWRLRL